MGGPTRRVADRRQGASLQAAGRRRGQKIDAAAVLERVKREGPDSLLSRGEAAALIASRIAKPGESVRTVRNRVGTQIDRDLWEGAVVVGDGRVSQIGPRYKVDEVARWARVRYEADISGLPIASRTYSNKVVERAGASGSADPGVLPGALSACHELIEALRTECDALKEKIASESEARKEELTSRLNRKPKKVNTENDALG